MNISIFGLGYVGCVSAAVLYHQGHNVIGVDVSEHKINLINSGKTPIIEEKVGNYLAKGVEEGKIRATNNPSYAIKNSEVSIICVGTPSAKDDSTDLKYVNKVIEEVSEQLKSKETAHTIIIRSTIPPGTIEKNILPKLKEANPNVGICFNPEFLREGSAVKDYYNPPYIIVAINNANTEMVLRELYKDISSEFIVTDYKTAEMLKVINNVFRALKVTFSNEVARFSEAHGMDGKEIMRLVCKDTKQNISSKYLMPGHAYGGSCLPKDLRGLVYLAKQKNMVLPVIENIAMSNNQHIDSVIKKIKEHGSKKIGFVGLSFKTGTDDLRESPSLRLVEHFIGKGYDIKVFDPHVQLSRLLGANKDYLEQELPQISSLLVNEASEFSDRDLIIYNREEEFNYPHQKDVLKLH
jgi:GDP-mannose 6-dehydrogenase